MRCDCVTPWSLARRENMTSNRLDFVYVNMCITIPYLCRMDLRLRGHVTMLSRQAPPGGFVGGKHVERSMHGIRGLSEADEFEPAGGSRGIHREVGLYSC